MADHNQASIQDYDSQVPGLSLTPNEFGGAPTIAIRGITSGDFTNPTVGITVDDVPFGPSTVNGGGYFAPDLPRMPSRPPPRRRINRTRNYRRSSSRAH